MSTMGFAVIIANIGITILSGCVIYLFSWVRMLDSRQYYERRGERRGGPVTRAARRESRRQSKSTAGASSSGSAK